MSIWPAWLFGQARNRLSICTNLNDSWNRALCGSRYLQISSAVESSLPSECWVNDCKESKDRHSTKWLGLLILFFNMLVCEKDESPISQVPIFKLLPDMPFLFIAAYQLFKLRLTAGRISLYCSGPWTALYIFKSVKWRKKIFSADKTTW